MLFYLLSKLHSQVMLSVWRRQGMSASDPNPTYVKCNIKVSPRTWHGARGHGGVEGLEEHAGEVEAVELLERRCAGSSTSRTG